jgi:hypothetical protein
MSQFNRITNTDFPASSGGPPNMAPMWGADGNQVSALSPEHTLMPYAEIDNKPISQFQNGRVIGVADTKTGKQFELFTENNNNCNNTKETILYGTLTRSTLSDTFFSKENMKILQNSLRYRVYAASGGEYVIGEQDNTELTIIMRSMYLMYSKNLPYNIKEQIQELNQQVINYILPKIVSEIKQWIFYTSDIQRLPQPIDLPRNLSNKGTRTLKSVVDTF